MKRFSSGDQQVEVPQEVIAFLNFYLENRPQRSRFLFISNSAKAKVKPLPVKNLEKALSKVLDNAGLAAAEVKASEMLRSSGYIAQQTSSAPTTTDSATEDLTRLRLQPNYESWTYSGNQHVA